MVGFSALIFYVFCAAALSIPISFAADLVNINTADSATLETLNGIGPSKAQAIIDYRTQHGPFAAKEDIMNVSGIGTATYNNIKDFITVGTASPQVQTQTQTQSQAQSSQPTSTPIAAGGAAVPSLAVRIVADARTTAGAGSVFRGEAYGTEDELIGNARYLWNFGDGSTAEGAVVFHTYAYPGTYILMLTGASGILSGSAKMNIVVVSPQVRFLAERDGSLTIYNDSAAELAVGFWRLTRGEASFVIPEGTLIAAGGAVRFAPALLNLPPGKAELLYPNGSVAAREGMSPHTEGITYLSSSQVKAAPRPAASFASAALEPEERGAAPVSNLAAATANDGSSIPLWGSALGLLALIILGVAATLYGRLPIPSLAAASAPLSAREETAALAREFEIIDVTPVEEEDPSR